MPLNAPQQWIGPQGSKRESFSLNCSLLRQGPNQNCLIIRWASRKGQAVTLSTLLWYLLMSSLSKCQQCYCYQTTATCLISTSGWSKRLTHCPRLHVLKSSSAWSGCLLLVFACKWLHILEYEKGSGWMVLDLCLLYHLCFYVEPRASGKIKWLDLTGVHLERYTIKYSAKGQYSC